MSGRSKNIWKCGCWLAVCLAFLLAQSVAAAPIITGMRSEPYAGGERLTFRLTEWCAHEAFALENPPRFVIDLPAMNWDMHHQEAVLFPGSIVQHVRYGQHDADTTRIVLDLERPAYIKGSFVAPVEEGGGYRLVVDYAAGEGKDQTHETILSLSPPEGRIEPEAPEEIPEPLMDRPTLPLASESDVPVPLPKPVRPGANLPKDYRPLVILDAGHGGADPGAIGIGGAYEKYVTLAYSRHVKAALEKTGRYRVRLTRDGDRFIPLRRRVGFARESKGDVFLSLHADSAPRAGVRGLSVYSLSEQASDAEAAALASRENKADIIAGIDLSGASLDVADILIDLAQRETNNKSVQLADLLVSAMPERVRLLENPHRFAGFVVLKAPDIPSVLVEVGFLSNAHDEKLLDTREHRDLVAKGIITALDAFFARHPVTR